MRLAHMCPVNVIGGGEITHLHLDRRFSGDDLVKNGIEPKIKSHKLLFHRHRMIAAALYRRVVRRDEAVDARNPPDACDQASGQVNSQSLVRYKTNDYSVPVAYGHRDVWLRGYVDQVVIGCGGDVIARHPRCWDREDMVFDPVHYLPLLEQKVGALDQAAPLAGWELPEEFATLRRLMEARMIKAGRREYVQVLRLLETFEMSDLQVAVKNALRLGAIGFDAVKHLVLCQIEKRPPKLDLDVYPYLPKANVGTTSAASYMSLMRGRAA